MTPPIATFSPDKARYWRDHAVMAVVFMALAGGVLLMLDVPAPAIGSLGALLAIAVRGGYLASEVLAQRWTLTETDLHLPAPQNPVPLHALASARPFLGGVQLITTGGDKHLMRHLADPAGVAAQINAARRG